MKDILVNINKLFESKVRLGIMSMLMVNDTVDFNSLKTHLDVTDGNLASHIASLEKAKYIKVNKSFIGKKPNTTYSVSATGRRSFNEHLDALERLINSSVK
ncbi:MAG TPA: transcriptional regulator [Ignavibacteria bacterium]|nr:transcriptional regulator [Ignavibacteria bacterium]HAX47532.1 transcriptional regulator [Bacteroidota bacterium]HRE10488.1 transcriptional regulator [Ignavibacteria bacterium]HRF65150.1 transcriptional regulator [Ignavibacteria bacterium]HRJ03980.1 transcriptional regulator [Ignavibacteria bacterium]